MNPLKNSIIMKWFEDRYPVEEVLTFFKKKVVPIHKYSFWYYFGGMTLFLLGIQVITGILLMLYYRPTAEHAFESVQFIMTNVNFGWLIRSIHSWSANILIFFAFVHMFSTYLLKAYRQPRELTWIMGVILFFLLLGFGFTGYLLPWNTLSFFATKVGTDIPGVVPIIGRFVLQFLRGGEDVTTTTLTRLFGLHVAVLPGITLVILGLHLMFIQVQGMSYPTHVTIKREITFYPDFLLRDSVGWLSAFALLLILATLYPWELGVKADPFAPTPEGIRPEWYFLFMFQTLKIVPSKLLFFDGEVVAIMTFGFVGVVWLLVPFLDRWTQRGLRSPLFTGIGIVGIIYIIIMTITAYIY